MSQVKVTARVSWALYGRLAMNPTTVMANTFVAAGVTLAGIWADGLLLGVVLGVTAAVTGATAMALADKKLAQAKVRARRRR